MLNKIGILDNTELKAIKEKLKEIIELEKEGKFKITPEDEDVHTKIENHLTKELRDVGKKIHTYRSRNDQALVDQRLYNKEKLIELWKEINGLCKTLLEFTKDHKEVPMPGYTHLQKAMLSSVGLWSGAYLESLLDDLKLLKTAFELNNQCPLGSAAGYGVPADIDREFVAEKLGFEKVQKNSLYCQNSRGKFEAAIAPMLSQVMLDLSQMSTDLILFSTEEFGYFELSNEITTGSSIMPQKKNPDVLEMIKGKANQVIGLESEIKNSLKSLPSGYMKETQPTKGAIMEALKLTINSVELMQLVVKTLKVNEEECKAACNKSIFATYHAYELVEKGMPFRKAYKKTAKNLEEIEKPSLSEALSKRSHIGSTGNLGLSKLEDQVNKQVELAEERIGKWENTVLGLIGGKGDQKEN